MLFRFADLVGTYRLVVSDELRAFVERAVIAVAPEAEQDAIRKVQLHEAAGAEFAVRVAGGFIRGGTGMCSRGRGPWDGTCGIGS